MKLVLLTGAAALLITAQLITAQAALAQPANGPVCLSTRNIANTSPSPDGTAITFRMTDGSVWRNDLHGSCPDLWFTGFAWAVRNGDGTVCENQDTLHVLRSAEICTLGKFTQLTPSRAEQHAQR